MPGALGIARAEGKYEFRQQRGLLVFEEFQHWANLRYSYHDHAFTQDGNRTSSSVHAFKESYNASLATAIYDPHLLDTTLQVGIQFDQNSSRFDGEPSSGNSATYQYHFSGTGLDRSPTPFTLLSYRDINTVESTYSLPYTSDNSGTEVDVAIRNVTVPSRFHFAHITLDTRGGGNNNSSVSNSYSYSAEHKYNFSSTGLQLRFSDQTGGGAGSAKTSRTSNTLSITNSLAMGEQKKYSLLTWFNFQNSRTDTFPERIVELRETLVGRLGKALSLEVVYAYSDSRRTDDTGVAQESTINRGEVTLKHKLFSSLETTLNGTASSNRMEDGTEDRYSGTLGVRYVKHLSKSDVLTLGVTKVYEQVDRTIDSATVRITDELHAAVHQGDIIELSLGDTTLNAVISVKSRNPDFTYEEDRDYTVNIPFGRIEIRAGGSGRIDIDGQGMDLYITYRVTMSPVINYATDTLSVSSDLSLLDSSLHVGASYLESNQTLLGGTDLYNSLGRSRSMSVYAGGRYENYNGRITFRDVVNEKLAYRSLEGRGMATWRFGPSTFSLTSRDRYYQYDATASAAGYGENVADISLSYSRNILLNMKLNILANALDIRSDAKKTRDSMSLRAIYRIALNKSVLTLSGQSVWLLFNGGVTRDNALQVDFSRTF